MTVVELVRGAVVVKVRNRVKGVDATKITVEKETNRWRDSNEHSWLVESQVTEAISY